jgi:hypothetical protein
VASGVEAALDLEGVVTLSGRRYHVSLSVRPSEQGTMAGTLSIPELDVVASGPGRRDAGLVLQLTYAIDCPGRARVRITADGNGNWVGSLAAEDCTGKVIGPLELAPGS